MKKKVPQSVGDCFDMIERVMIAGPWVMGNDYTICDPYLFTIARWLEGDSVDIAQFPKVQDHRRRNMRTASKFNGLLPKNLPDVGV